MGRGHEVQLLVAGHGHGEVKARKLLLQKALVLAHVAMVDRGVGEPVGEGFALVDRSLKDGDLLPRGLEDPGQAREGADLALLPSSESRM